MLLSLVPGNPAAGSPDDENWGMQYAGPHMTFGSSWACQTSQLPYSQGQQTPSLFLLPNINLPLPFLGTLGSVPETEATSQDYTTEIAVVLFFLDFISCRWCSRLINNHKRPDTSSCLTKWQNNRFAYVKAGARTGLSAPDPKHVKEVQLQQLSQRY